MNKNVHCMHFKGEEKLHSDSEALEVLSTLRDYGV